MAPRHPIAYWSTYQQDLAIFYHQILCWPTKLTLLQAIKDGSFSTWPGLTEKIISKYLPELEITEKGHLDQQKQRPVATEATNVTPLSTKAGWNTSEVLLQLFGPTEKNLFWPNWKISRQSYKGDNYILVAYHYDANNILTTSLKNRTGPCILNGITKIHDRLRKRGLTPKLHIMDNEVSEDIKQYFEDSYIKFQLVPPHMHRINDV